MAVRGNLMAKMPMLSGSPSQQATKAGLSAKGMPKMSPGKPARSIVGKPASTPVNRGTKQPKGKSSPKVANSKASGSSIKGAPRGLGRPERGGRINPADMGI